MLIERAPAKINLTLHLLRRRADGYHELESLVVFTRAGDTLALRPGDQLRLFVEGPTGELAGDPSQNLVCKAARALAERVEGLRLGTFELTKRLPVAAGIGGGSSDAAAALRLLARANALDLDDPRLIEAARATGADVPVCLHHRARMMRGIGDELGPPLDLPPLFAVLVNPGVPMETRTVFARIGLEPGEDCAFGKHPAFASAMPRETLFSALRKSRNDLEDAANVLNPVVGHVLAVLAAGRGCRLARMSGSGATCFALFETCRAATAAARVIRRDHPGWWVKTALLG
jgi:4-diphosphocytidyl-2-C-methyl-D-erythritol kinase